VALISSVRVSPKHPGHPPVASSCVRSALVGQAVNTESRSPFFGDRSVSSRDAEFRSPESGRAGSSSTPDPPAGQLLCHIAHFPIVLGVGDLTVHTSNLHFGLRPVVEASADSHRLSMVTVQSEITNYGGLGSDWELLSRNSQPLDTVWIRRGASPASARRVLWTDDHASLLRAWFDR